MLKTQRPVGLSIGRIDSLHLHERKPVITFLEEGSTLTLTKRQDVGGHPDAWRT